MNKNTMRGRALLAGTALTLLALLWSAPAALAADQPDDPNPPTTSTRQGSGGGQSDEGNGRETETPTPKPPPQPPQAPPTTPTPQLQPQPQSPTTTPAPRPQPELPTADLHVYPKMVKQGGTIYVSSGACYNSEKQSLSAPDVTFSGPDDYSGDVSPNASLGAHTMTLVCANRWGQATASDTFQVVPGDEDPEASVSVSPETVQQGGTISTIPVCSYSEKQQLSAPDVTFTGDAGKVSDHASLGAHTVTLVCANGAKQATAYATFQVVPPIPPVTASVSVSPEEVEQGKPITADVTCSPGSAPGSVVWPPDVTHGPPQQGANPGTVNPNASLGLHTVTLVCGGPSGKATASDTFQVVPKGGPGGEDPGNGNAEPPAGGQYVPVYPKGGVETGGGPVAASPAGGVALGLAGLTSGGGAPGRPGGRR